MQPDLQFVWTYTIDKSGVWYRPLGASVRACDDGMRHVEARTLTDLRRIVRYLRSLGFKRTKGQ